MRLAREPQPGDTSRGRLQSGRTRRVARRARRHARSPRLRAARHTQLHSLRLVAQSRSDRRTAERDLDERVAHLFARVQSI